MVKFLLITFLIWFVLTRLLRLRVIVYKGNERGGSFWGGHYKREGAVRVEKEPNKGKDQNRSVGGDYVDYEEV